MDDPAETPLPIHHQHLIEARSDIVTRLLERLMKRSIPVVGRGHCVICIAGQSNAHANAQANAQARERGQEFRRD